MDKISQMNQVLAGFKIKAVCEAHEKIRNISFYDVRLSPGCRVRDIEKWGREMALQLHSRSAPMIQDISSKGIVQLQMVDEDPSMIDFVKRHAELLMPQDMILPFYLGDTIKGQPLWIDQHTAPHTLIAGATGSGKSTLLHSIVGNVHQLPNVDLHLIDTKQIEFSPYEGVNSNTTVDFSYLDAVERLNKLYFQMNKTYDVMRQNKLPANYFSTRACTLPYTVVVIDEFADLVMQDDGDRLYELVCKIAQKGRAAGIHLIIATQRPSTDVFRGSMKANFPTRIACRVSSRVDSQVILDQPGAQLLLGRGDALIRSNQHELRFQAAWSGPSTIVAQG